MHQQHFLATIFFRFSQQVINLLILPPPQHIYICRLAGIVFVCNMCSYLNCTFTIFVAVEGMRVRSIYILSKVSLLWSRVCLCECAKNTANTPWEKDEIRGDATIILLVAIRCNGRLLHNGSTYLTYFPTSNFFVVVVVFLVLLNIQLKYINIYTLLFFRLYGFFCCWMLNADPVLQSDYIVFREHLHLFKQQPDVVTFCVRVFVVVGLPLPPPSRKRLF